MIKKNFTIDFILAPKLDHISASATTISTNINNNNNSNRSNIKNSINNNTNDGITNITNTECNSDETVVQLNVEVDNYSIDGDGDGEGDSDFNGIGGLSQYSTSPSSATDRTQFRDPDKKTIPFCAKCKIHGQYFPVKNHKDQCKRRFCNCVNCKLIDKGKTLRGKKVKRDTSLDCRSNRSNRRASPRDVMALAGQYKSDLKCLISKEPGPEGSRMERLLSSILNFLLKKNGFDADSLKKKFRAVARFIEEKKRGRNCNILGGINSLHGESSEVVGPSSPPSFTERLNLDRPRHLSSSSATNFSPQSLTCLSTSPNTIIIPTNLPPPLISSCSPLTGPGTLTSPPTGIPGGGTGTVLTFTPTPLLSKSTKGANNTSSLSSSSASSSISSTSSSASSSLTSAAAAAAACSSILSLTGTEYSVSSVTAIPQPTIFSSSLFCPTYPYSPLVTTGGPLQSPYQTINCPTGIIRSPSSSVSPGKSSFSPHHQPVSARNSPNSCANFNRTNHNVSIHLADTLHKSTNHHNHQHATSLYSFLGSNSGAINLSKRLN